MWNFVWNMFLCCFCFSVLGEMTSWRKLASDVEFCVNTFEHHLNFIIIIPKKCDWAHNSINTREFRAKRVNKMLSLLFANDLEFLI